MGLLFKPIVQLYLYFTRKSKILGQKKNTLKFLLQGGEVRDSRGKKNKI